MRLIAPRWLLLCMLLLAGCSTGTGPTPPPTLTPEGPHALRVGTALPFEVTNITGAVVWSVDGIEGGDATVGTVADGTFDAPARIPAGGDVAVTATDAATPSRFATATVRITAPGTLYVIDDEVHVYGDLDVVDGDVAPDRSFSLAGVPGSLYDMVIAPALDLGFITVNDVVPSIHRVPNISSASGVVTATWFDDDGLLHPAGVAYDAARDVLYVLFDNALLAYEGASTAPSGTAAAREISGPTAGAAFESDARMAYDVATDRLFISTPSGFVSVYDEISTIDGDVAPARSMDLDAPHHYIWGIAYDPFRDELYLGDQKDGTGVYVLANASTATGPVVPARSIGGPTHSLEGAAQLGYDVANDRLVVIDASANDVKVYDQASTVDGDVAPTRVIGGSALPITYPYGGHLDPTQ